MPLKYRSFLKLHSQQLRSNMTVHEKILWEQIRRKQIEGVRFLRQKPIGDFIVDFYAPEVQLVIELDGSQHLEPDMIELDKKRDQYLQSLGLTVLRFENCLVERCLDLVIVDIVRWVKRTGTNIPDRTSPRSLRSRSPSKGTNKNILVPFEGDHTSKRSEDE